MAAELFDLLGEAVFEHIADLLQQRPSVVANVRRLVGGYREAEAADKGVMAAGPSYGPTVTVTSESQVGGGNRGLEWIASVLDNCLHEHA